MNCMLKRANDGARTEADLGQAVDHECRSALRQFCVAEQERVGRYDDQVRRHAQRAVRETRRASAAFVRAHIAVAVFGLGLGCRCRCGMRMVDMHGRGRRREGFGWWLR